MSTYADELITALSAQGIEAEVDETGGGCQEVSVLPDYRFGITNGDAELPDDDMVLVSAYDEDGSSEDQLWLAIYKPFTENPEQVAARIAQWIGENR